MARSESAISVLQCDERFALHVSFAAEEGGFRIERLDARMFSAVPDAASLRAFAAETGLPEHAFITIIPRHHATLRILALPSRDPAEIASMVALGSEELAPYPREQLIVRHHILSGLATGESRVLVVLLHREVIAQHVGRLQAAGLEPGQIVFSTACIHAVASASPDAPSERYALACVSEDALELMVIHDGALEFSRGVAHHAPWNLEDSASREALGHEIRDALAAYRRESDEGEGLDVLYVTGDRMAAGPLAVALESVTGRPCRPATFLGDLIRGDGAAGGGIPVMALGAALSACGRAPLSFDFLPNALLQARAVRDVRAGLRRVAVLAAVVVLLLLAAFGQSLAQRRALIKELRSRADAVAPGAEDIAAKQRGLVAIARQVDRGGNFLALLAAVAQAAPAEGFNITRVEYDRQTGVNIWGRARTKDLVLGDFLGNLRRLGEGSLAQLAQAHSQYETPGQERDQNIIHYQVSIPALPEEPSHDAPAPDR